MISIDKDSIVPIYQQIYECAKRDIIVGAFEHGQKLPSIRALSSRLGIARNTVDAAYRQLQVEGFVESKQGSGFIVLEVPRDALLEEHSGSRYVAPSEERVDSCTYDFRYGSLAAGSFPAEDWRKLSQEVLSEHYASALSSYGNDHGEFGLREQIARHLRLERGVTCAPEQVIITSGTQQALELVCRMFDSRTTRICMEDPGFRPARLVFESLGFELDYACTEHGSARYLHDVSRTRSRLIYTTPSHQFPMGTCMDVASRLELIELAERNDAFIIEDNYDSEFRYNANPVPSLQSTDHLGRVIYVGTFSKALSPALRMSYLVLPPKMVKRYRERFKGMRCTVPRIEQETMRLFMERGLWAKHLHRACLANRKRHDLLLQTLHGVFGERAAIHEGDAGLFVLLDVESDMTQAQLVDAAGEHGIGLSPSTDCWADPAHAPQQLVLLGFSAADEQQISRGVPLLYKAWFGN